MIRIALNHITTTSTLGQDVHAIILSDEAMERISNLRQPLNLTVEIHVKKKRRLFFKKNLPDDKTRLILQFSKKLKVHDIQIMRDNRKASTHPILAGLVSV
jgi:hypothetical protein